MKAIILALLLCLTLALPVRAHPLQVEPVIATLHPQASFISVLLTGNIQDVTVGVNVAGGERQGDRITKAAQERLAKYINDHFKMALNGVPLTGTLTDFSFQGSLDPTRARFDLAMRYDKPAVKTPGVVYAAASAHSKTDTVAKPAAAPSKKGVLTITSTLFDYLPNSKTILSINGLQKTLTQGEPTSIDPSALATNLLHNIVDFMQLGIMHIFTGPDHMLFILSLLLVSTSLHSLIKTLTGFTIAHSITLALSALSIVVIDNRVCDIFIALSIIYVGVENILKPDSKYRFWVASSFGLVHGFGFSGALREVGLPQQGLGWCLLSFNLGVEIAQVIICALAFPLLMLWKRDTDKRAQYGSMNWRRVINVASIWVVLMGGYWLVQRAIG